ncbi:hypothetical protein FZ084_14830 [Listeria monocytogenes]|uniref:hypothetical protein n=1 Tax=Listeria monocytogenes TaxID=1639 RepID=UPI0011EB5D2D|nr:hypothetical protein [Listeria monocytogenes]TYW25161.1 hypothetical protein FZ084_14830 [Listeria monocytogenes]
MDKRETAGWILGMLEAVSICLQAGDETIAMEILKSGEIKRYEAEESDFIAFEEIDEYIESMKPDLPDWYLNKMNENSEDDCMENMKQYEIKTIENGWTRLENYRDGYVVAIKAFQGICVNITNFSSSSLHGYSIEDLEKGTGDWSYIFDEQLLERVDGEDELKTVLEKYHLTEAEITEVLSYDFDNRYSESYELQAKRIQAYMRNE